jgi:hypothetical protein
MYSIVFNHFQNLLKASKHQILNDEILALNFIYVVIYYFHR